MGGIRLRDSSPGTPHEYGGLWYLSNVSYRAVGIEDGRLWMDETHVDSHQVWNGGGRNGRPETDSACIGHVGLGPMQANIVIAY